MTGQFHYFYFSVLHLGMLTYWLCFEMVKVILSFKKISLYIISFSVVLFRKSWSEFLGSLNVSGNRWLVCSVIVYRLGWMALLREVLLHVMIFSCTFVKYFVMWWMFDRFEPYCFWKCVWLQLRESDCCWLRLCTTFLAIVYIWKMNVKMILSWLTTNVICDVTDIIKYFLYTLCFVSLCDIAEYPFFFHSFLSCLFPIYRIQRMSCVHVSVTWRRVPPDMALTCTQRSRNLASTSGRWMRTPQQRNLDFSPKIK